MLDTSSLSRGDRAVVPAWIGESLFHILAVHERQVQCVGKCLVGAAHKVICACGPRFDCPSQELWPVADDAQGHCGWILRDRCQRLQRGNSKLMIDMWQAGRGACAHILVTGPAVGMASESLSANITLQMLSQLYKPSPLRWS